MKAEGVAVLQVGQPDDFPAIRAETRRLAQALHVPARGEALVAGMDARLAALTRPARRRTAIAWEPRGYTAGPGSLLGAVLRAAGLADVASGRRLGVEALRRRPPDLLVVPETPAYPSLATQLLQDPAVATIPRRAVPPALTICAGPFTARAAEMLAH